MQHLLRILQPTAITSQSVTERLVERASLSEFKTYIELKLSRHLRKCSMLDHFPDFSLAFFRK